MIDSSFSNFFSFNNFNYKHLWHNDNSHGIDKHFIGYMKEGNARIVSERNTLELSQGDMFYIPRGLKYHSFWNTKGVETTIISIGFTYFPSDCMSGYELSIVSYNPEIFDLLMYFSSKQPVTCESVSALYSLLDQTESLLTKKHDSKCDITTNALIDLMDKDPHKKMDEYAEQLGISVALLYKYINKSLGKSPNRLRQETLCKKAIVLLETSAYSVEEICTKCGFSSTSYLRKVLHSVTQKTPTQIRNQAKNM